MQGSTQAQRGERVTAAEELLARGTSMAEAAVALSRDFGLSRRQAYRYLEAAQGVGRAGAGDRRDLGDDYAEDSAQHRTGAAGLLREQRADPERDRTTCDIGVSVGSARTWLSGAGH